MRVIMRMLMRVFMIMVMIMSMSLLARTHNTQALGQPLMRGIHPPDALWLFDHLQIRQVDGNGLAVAPHQHTLELLVFPRVDLLVRHVRRHEYEIARPGLGHELKLLAPAQPGTPFEDVDDGF